MLARVAAPTTEQGRSAPIASEERGEEGRGGEEEEEEEVSVAGIEAVLGYRTFLGNEQWRVLWSVSGDASGHAGEQEETWEVYRVLDTKRLRREADAWRF